MSSSEVHARESSATVDHPVSPPPQAAPEEIATGAAPAVSGQTSSDSPIDGPDVRPDVRAPLDPGGRSSVRSPIRVHKRMITRYSFEFYRDQIENLRDLSLEEKQLGEAGSMSAMVRDAVDDYLAKRVRAER